ncbi:unnamed protein product [Schistosoma mattheei]|uniref:Uncharacterized protein n=1 Tax=Schistosoma mattheei TaxID=31246 RepID=A0A3P8FK06_9TREM|nr:unnamed protein product [Schistosoma mattheei]
MFNCPAHIFLSSNYSENFRIRTNIRILQTCLCIFKNFTHSWIFTSKKTRPYLFENIYLLYIVLLFH